MDDSATTVERHALALRAEAIEICGCFTWQPQCIGSGTFDAGVRGLCRSATAAVRAVYVSQALIDCCKRHRLWFPLFEDVQARIWVFLRQRERAEQLWRSCCITQRVGSEVAKSRSRPWKIRFSLVKCLQQRWCKHDRTEDRPHALLTEAILEIEDLDEPFLQAVLETTALKILMRVIPMGSRFIHEPIDAASLRPAARPVGAAARWLIQSATWSR